MNARDWFSTNWFNIVTGLIGLIVVITTAIMVISQRTIPDNWAMIVVTVVSFFFGLQVPTSRERNNGV